MTGDYEQQLVIWAHTYKAYERFASTPHHIEACLAPVLQEWERNRRVPEWAGVDLLRAWAFCCVRSHHFDDWEPLLVAYPQVGAIADAIRNHPSARKDDIPPPAEQIDLNRYYLDFALGSKFERFGLWAPARVDGKHRFAVVYEPDGYTNHVGLAGEVSRLQFEHPDTNIFVGGWADHRPEYLGLDYWPLGLITPDDFHIGFRHRNGLPNPESRQALGYAKARLKSASIDPGGKTTTQ